MTYVELHCHSAYSFLDGASQPEELAARAAELGYEALALTDHDGVYGSLEFAHAAKAFGVRPITGAEVTLEGGCHVTLLVETPEGLREPLPAAHRGTRRHAAEARGRAPAARVDSPVTPGSERRASSASPAAPGTGSARTTRTRPPRSPGRSPTGSSSSSSGRTSAATPAGSPGSRSSPATSACRRSRPATSTRTTSGAPRSRTRSSRSAAAPRSTAASPSGAGTTSPSSSPPEAMLDRLPADAVHRSGEIAAGLAVRPDAGARLPLPRLLRRLRDAGRPAPRSV